ncbi:uncharacterized protein F5147DRAFT_778854 [Suillus discolor]|uniref:Uncharacterized protein n=1 Tax=Suillus discolor TaxID=1912936 RepID=A0A9P7EXX2_9AGAM|nr:uncharacterized protein F5147DRAFT_778854 [Suillus discolor]KAG2094827.1 hypothetical protein F5147DRAFT_778854 [Suillus discolor]
MSCDAIVGHLKVHVYNSTSLTAVDDAFNDGTHNDPSTPNSTLNHDRDQSQAPEGWDDSLKWIKLELIRQVAQLGGKCTWDKNFSWKGMSSALADANLCIRGYPAHKCLLPGEAHNENSRNKGIGALMQKEIAVLVDGLKAGTMQVVKVDKAHRAAVMASERPVITGIAPPPEWPHDGARRLFANGDTDYHGPAHLQPSSAATKFCKPTIRLDLPAPLPSRLFKVVVPPNPRPVKTVRKPEPAAAESEVIELTSTEENAVEESDTKYEEARGKKRKLKATNMSRALKKLASSEEKTDASKAGKKGTRAQTKSPKVPPMLTSTTSLTKGGPLSPLTVGSSSVAASPEPGTVVPARLRDGPSNERTKVKPRPITKASKGKMKRILCMAYSQSDESEVDEGKKMDVMVAESAVSPGLVNVPAESLQEGSPKVMHDDRPAGTQQELPQITKPIEDLHDAVRDSRDPHDPHDPPHDLHQVHHKLPIRHDPHEGVQQDLRKGNPPCHPQEPHREVTPNPRDDPREGGPPPRHPQEPHQEVTPNPRDDLREGGPLRNSHEPRHDPRNALHDTRQPLRGHSREPWYMHDAMHHHEVHLREESPMIEHDTLHSCDVFYHRDSHNHRYASLQPRDYYGPNEPCTDSEFTMQDTSPALESHYTHGEHERAYPSRYSPVLSPDYAHESRYARRNGLDKRQAFGGGAYRDSRYPQGRAHNQDSRWTDNVRNVASSSLDYVRRDAVPRAFNRDPTNPPHPPSS